MKPSKPWRLLARHKWVAGAMISESRRDDMTDRSEQRSYTATIRGYGGWQIYRGIVGDPLLIPFIIARIRQIRDRIDDGDEDIFLEPNEFATTMLELWPCDTCQYKRAWNCEEWCTHPNVECVIGPQQIPVNFTIPDFCPLSVPLSRRNDNKEAADETES